MSERYDCIEMKILFLNHSDSKESLQGGQLALIELVQQWQQKNSEIEPVFISIGEHGKFSEICSQNGWTCFVLALDWWLETKGPRNHKFRSSQFLSDLSSVTQIRQIINDVKPSMCFTNTITTPWLAYASAAEGVPHVWSCHESGDFNKELSYRYGLDETYKIIGDLSQLVIANSASTFEYLSKFVSLEKITLLPPVRSKETLNRLLHSSEKNSIQPTTKPKNNVFTIGCFGAVNQNKNQQLLFEALSPIALSGREFKLVIAGNIDQGYWASQTRSGYFRNIANNMDVLESVSNPLPIMSSCDLVVSTSHYESFGMSLFESQFAGVPVVSTPHHGALEIIQNGITGTVLASYNPGELSEVILGYMNSESLTQAQGKAAASITREFLENTLALKIELLTRLEIIASGAVQLNNQSPLVALLDQSVKALPRDELAKLSGLMGSIRVQKKYSPQFLYRVLKSRFGKGR
jgi:glycosyltransferase involved in cell wall biosynthesis